MCDAVSLTLGAISLATGGYAAWEQKKASDQATAAQKAATNATLEAAKTTGPEQQTIDYSDISTQRTKALRAGLAANMTSGEQGDLSTIATANYGKTKMGA